METNALKIVMVDVSGSEQTLKFENPVSGLTMEQVRTAFADQFNTDTAVIVSQRLEYFTAAKSAYYEVISRTNLT